MTFKDVFFEAVQFGAARTAEPNYNLGLATFSCAVIIWFEPGGRNQITIWAEARVTKLNYPVQRRRSGRRRCTVWVAEWDTNGWKPSRGLGAEWFVENARFSKPFTFMKTFRK
jgi:hypothetical protein